LTDRAWAAIEPLLPPVSGGGRRWRDHRQVINAILWKLRTGAPWRGLPERYGPWKTAHERLRLWTCDGTWPKIVDDVIVKDDSVGAVEWIISVDSTVVRAHQPGLGCERKVQVTASVLSSGGVHHRRTRRPVERSTAARTRPAPARRRGQDHPRTAVKRLSIEHVRRTRTP
jgi:transposase